MIYIYIYTCVCIYIYILYVFFCKRALFTNGLGNQEDAHSPILEIFQMCLFGPKNRDAMVHFGRMGNGGHKIGVPSLVG